MKSDFISTVSHELRTPLTSIKGYIATLLHPATKFDGATQRDFLQIMNREADRLSGLISDLLEVSKIESQKFRMNPSLQDLMIIVRKMVEKYRQLHQKHSFELTGPDCLELEIDGAQIEYVLHHLLSNAVKYSPKGGKIEVQVQPVDEKIYVSVRDQGVGIPFDEQEKIFDRFYRVDNRPTRWAYGWGLGLFIVRKVVEAHGGRIWVESVLGGGSRFTRTLSSQNSMDTLQKKGLG
jgi:signal transduction histidine kinase